MVPFSTSVRELMTFLHDQATEVLTRPSPQEVHDEFVESHMYTSLVDMSPCLL